MARTPPTPLASGDRGLNIKQAAARVGVHYQTMRNWLRNYDEGREPAVPYTLVGASAPGRRRNIRINPVDLEPLMARPGGGE